MKQKLINLYLDWWNNFLTVDRFASYYDLTIGQALRVIRLGRTLHEQNVRQFSNPEQS